MNRKMKTFGAIALAVAAVVSLGWLAPSAASASTATEEEAAFMVMADGLSDFMTEHGVPAATQAALIDKLHGGELLDSMDGSAPASTQTVGGVTLETFADGSIRELSVSPVVPPPAPGTVTPMAGIAGCTSSTSGIYSYRTGCSVERWDGIIVQRFYANFTYLTPGYDRIDSVYSATYSVYGANSASQTYFGRVKATENASGPAVAEQRVSAQLPIIGSVSYYLRLNVGAGGATASAA